MKLFSTLKFSREFTIYTDQIVSLEDIEHGEIRRIPCYPKGDVLNCSSYMPLKHN
jgi:hypothetical protein